MKKYLILMIIVSAMAVSAQEKETLIKGDLESGGFGGPILKMTNINDEFGAIIGGYGGWIINHSLFLGAGGMGLVTTHKADRIVATSLNFGRDTYLNFGYGGIIVGYFFQPEKLFHYSANLLVGGGEVSYSSNRPFDDNHNDNDLAKDVVFVLEPTLQGELNVTTFFKIGVGFSYRIITSTNLLNIKNSDLSGPSAIIDFKFGKF